MAILTVRCAGLLSLILTVVACRAQPEVQARASALQGTSDPELVWVRMKDQADLEPARAISDWSARGAAVREALLATASDKQQSIQRFLVSRSAKFEPLWIVNVLRVRADAATIELLKSRSDVAEVSAERLYRIPEPQPSAANAANGGAGMRWGLSSIRALEAWQSSGSHGEGIVVGSIDSGVQFRSPRAGAPVPRKPRRQLRPQLQLARPEPGVWQSLACAL
jgi:hypothetical protein